MQSQARRSLSAALKTVELTPEAQAFLDGGTPKALVERPLEPPALKTELSLVSEKELPEASEEPRKQSGLKSTASKAESFIAAPRLAFTSLRLPVEIPDALLRASFDRKLKREKPWTQQDIAAEALSLWLKKRGYL